MSGFRAFMAVAGAGAGIALATPASAAVLLCSSGPGIDLTVDQCIGPVTPTPSGNDHLADVEAAIAAATGVSAASLNLSLFGKSDVNPDKFSFSPNLDPKNGQTTDWTVLDGTLIKYVTVKGANNFKLYELPGLGSASGADFSTLGILNGGGQQPAISHLSFWTTPGGAVPEPATWAMMLLGFGLVGGVMRRRQRQSVRLRFA